MVPRNAPRVGRGIRRSVPGTRDFNWRQAVDFISEPFVPGNYYNSDTGRLQAFSVIHLEFVGQTRKPPYVYAEIVLDGSATRLIHTVAGIDVAKAAEQLTIGMPVRAVWKDVADCRGTLDDIDYFEPIVGGGTV